MPNQSDPVFTFEIVTEPNGCKNAVVYKNKDVYVKWDFGVVFDEGDIEGVVDGLNSVQEKH